MRPRVTQGSEFVQFRLFNTWRESLCCCIVNIFYRNWWMVLNRFGFRWMQAGLYGSPVWGPLMPSCRVARVLRSLMESVPVQLELWLHPDIVMFTILFFGDDLKLLGGHDKKRPIRRPRTRAWTTAVAGRDIRRNLGRQCCEYRACWSSV